MGIRSNGPDPGFGGGKNGYGSDMYVKTLTKYFTTGKTHIKKVAFLVVGPLRV